MTEEASAFLESQHAMAKVIKANPASLAINNALGSESGVPSNFETTKAGEIANANPVSPSKIAVTLSNDLIYLKFCLLFQPIRITE